MTCINVFGRGREREKSATFIHLYTNYERFYTFDSAQSTLCLMMISACCRAFFSCFYFCCFFVSFISSTKSKLKYHTVLIKRHHSFAWFPSMFKLNDFRPSFSLGVSPHCVFFFFSCVCHILYSIWCDVIPDSFSHAIKQLWWNIKICSQPRRGKNNHNQYAKKREKQQTIQCMANKCICESTEMRVCAHASALSLWHFNLYLMRMVRYGVMLLFYFVKKTIIHLGAKLANTNHHHHHCPMHHARCIWSLPLVSSSFFCYFFSHNANTLPHQWRSKKRETEILGTLTHFSVVFAFLFQFNAIFSFL